MGKTAKRPSKQRYRFLLIQLVQSKCIQQGSERQPKFKKENKNSQKYYTLQYFYDFYLCTLN